MYVHVLKNVCLVLSSVTCILWKVGMYMHNSFLCQTRIFTSEEAAEIVLIIVLYTELY